MATSLILLLLASVVVVRGDNSNAIARGKTWVDAKVPYCQAANGAHDIDSSCASTCSRPKVAAWDAYRSDCSGFVSYAWGLPAPGRTTGDFSSVSSTIQCSALEPGDACVRPGHHIIMFVSWVTQGSNANFYEEPGCSGSVTYAHAFSSAVSCSGSSISIKGQSYTAIRYSGSVPGADNSTASNSTTPSGDTSGSPSSGDMSGSPSSGSMSGSKSNAGSSGNKSTKSTAAKPMTSAKTTTAAGNTTAAMSSTGGSTSSTTGTSTSTTSGTSSSSSAASTSSSGPASTSSTTGQSTSSPSSESSGSDTPQSSPSPEPSAGPEPSPSPAPAPPDNNEPSPSSPSYQAPAPQPPAQGDSPAPYSANSDDFSPSPSSYSGDSEEFVAVINQAAQAINPLGYGNVIWAPKGSKSTSTKPTWKTYGNCSDVPGTCQDIKYPCELTYLSYQCKGAVGVPNVRCCPKKQLVDIGLDGQWKLLPGQVTTESCAGLKFPLATTDLHFISVNWGGARDGGGRCHTGVDLFTQNQRSVVAMADGVVTNVISDFITCKNGGASVQAGAVMVYHPSIDQTVNYGEITSSTIAVKKGATIAQGQVLGQASACGLLHIELYNGSLSTPLRWNPAKGKKAYDPDGCTHNSLSVKPAKLLDPRPLINCLKPTTASLLQDAGVGGEQGVLTAVSGSSSINGGVIAAIVIVGLIVLIAIAFCIVCLVRRQQRLRGDDMGAVVVSNAMFDPSAAAVAAAGMSESAVELKPQFSTPAPASAQQQQQPNAPYSSGNAYSNSYGAGNNAYATGGYNGSNAYGSAGSNAYGNASSGTFASEGTMLRRPGGTTGTMGSDTMSGGFASARAEQVGEFKCPTCGKMYQYESDLATHSQLRHP